MKTENELVTTNHNRFAIHPLTNQNKTISHVTPELLKKVNKSQKSKKERKIDFLSVEFL